MKYSSGACAVIPEDQAQTMLAGVSAPLRIQTRKIPFLLGTRTRMRIHASLIPISLSQAMQMLQISGVLELRSQQLRHDALKLINATMCGTATTDFWNIMESFFRVDEDPDDATLDKAQSLADILKTRKQAEEKDKNTPSISKSTAEAESTGVQEDITIDEEDDDDASVVSTSSQTPSLKTLAQKKKETEKKYKNFCSLHEAQLFYPTSSTTMHTTGINPSHISERLKIGTSLQGLL